jgi:hypothetical protein
MSNGRMNGEHSIGEDVEEGSHDVIEVLSWSLLEGTRENHKKPLLRISGVLAEI